MHSEAVTISFRISKLKVETLGRLATALDRDRSYLLNEAVEQYLEVYEYHCKHIQEGLEQADRGQLVSDEVAQARIEALIGKANNH